MSVGKNFSRLETDIQKLNSIINELVEENYRLKVILSQSQPTTTPNKSTNNKQNK